MLVAAGLSFLEKQFTPRTVFMEIGAAPNGEMSTLALRAASYVERVYAIDVSGRCLQSVAAPPNLRLVRCDGVRIRVPESSVDLAWGGNFIDHLHPDDALAHLENVRRCLVDGGEYLLATQQPAAQVRRQLFAAGFSAVRISLLSRLFKPLRIAAVR
jgi:SAM-dependent methyltransferase